MNDTTVRAKVLITVMTYPHPSESYQELVCTAGITESLEWVRLYPVDYRYRPQDQKFKKYQWIDVVLGAPSPKSNDNRKESRRPDLNSIRLLGEPLSSKSGWSERRAIIDRIPHHTLNQIKALYDTERVSLGVVRPNRILDLGVPIATEKKTTIFTEAFVQ